MSAPELPKSISPDGSEVWDWAGKMSEHIHRQARIRELQGQIRAIGSECGGCDKWMKRSCPREVNDNGRKRGPSMSAPICNEFVMKQWSIDLSLTWEKELDALLAKTTQPPSRFRDLMKGE